MLQRRRAIIFLVIASILWSLGGLLIKLVNWNALAIAGMRSAITAVVLFIYLRRPHFHWSPAQVGGALAYTCTVILFVLATKLTTVANAILLQYSAPVYVALFGAKFLGEKTNWFDWVTIIIVLGGMTLFFVDELAAGGWLGNICAMLSAVSFSCLEAVLIPVLEPLLSPIWVLLLIGETPGWWAGVGGMIVLLAVTGRGILMTRVKSVGAALSE